LGAGLDRWVAEMSAFEGSSPYYLIKSLPDIAG